MAALPIEIVPGIRVGDGEQLLLIAGPCVIESRDQLFETAEKTKSIAEKLGIPFIFKSSFDKANRSSIKSYRGPGLQKGLALLQEVKRECNVPVLTDFHAPEQAAAVAEVADVIQVPAFLCRQTDMLVAAAKTGKTVNVKKGQFLSPWDVANIVEKIHESGGSQVTITERGSSFGYRNLVVDMKSIQVIREAGIPLVFDATHSVQLPGGRGDSTGGERQFIPTLAKAAVAAGADALFMEVHPSPESALSDGPNMWPLDKLESLLRQVMAIAEAVRK